MYALVINIHSMCVDTLGQVRVRKSHHAKRPLVLDQGQYPYCQLSTNESPSFIDQHAWSPNGDRIASTVTCRPGGGLAVVTGVLIWNATNGDVTSSTLKLILDAAAWTGRFSFCAPPAVAIMQDQPDLTPADPVIDISRTYIVTSKMSPANLQRQESMRSCCYRSLPISPFVYSSRLSRPREYGTNRVTGCNTNWQVTTWHGFLAMERGV